MITAQYIQMKKTEWDCGNSGELLWEYIESYNMEHRGQYKYRQISVGHWSDVVVGSFRGGELKIAQKEGEM